MAQLYSQRMWDPVGVRWVYYEKSFIDTAPLAAETQPNYICLVGQLTNHSVLRTRESSSQALWKWNETDTSQFQIAHDGIGSAALSVVTKSWGSALRVTWTTKTTGNVATFITIVDPAITKITNDRYRYTMRFRFCGFSGTAGEWYCIGPAFLCNKSTGAGFYGLGIGGQANTAGRYSRVQAGTLGLSSATPGWFNNGASAGFGSELNVTFENHVIARQPAASNPGFQCSVFGYKANDTATVRMVGGVNDAYWVPQVGAWGAGWASQTLDTCGIWILGATGTTAGQYMEFDLMSVYPHDMDR